MRLSKTIMNHAQHLREIFASAVVSVQPQNLIRANIQCANSTLTIVDQVLHLQKPCYAVGFGKAVYGMAMELHRILDANLKRGVLSIPCGSLEQYEMSTHGLHCSENVDKFKYFEGAKNNLPDLDAMRASREIELLCKSLDKDDVLIVLISGGGSALLPSTKEGITLETKQQLIKLLFDNGASINEVNSVRKRLSRLKGGGLAQVAHPARVISLILSDVVGDPLDIIASGPTVANCDHNSLAMDILERYNLKHLLSEQAIATLSKDSNYLHQNHEMFKNVENIVIGNNTLACCSAKEKADAFGYNALVLSTKVQGKVQDVARFYHDLAKHLTSKDDDETHLDALNNFDVDLAIVNKMKESTKPICLIFGGEPTIVVNNIDGRGGRNQHLALEFATLMKDSKNKHLVHFLSCGTDGIDGPTDAAGAISPMDLSNEDFSVAQVLLDRSDSFTFFNMYKNGEYLIKTGHTGTNVMDIHLLIVDKS